MKMIYLDQKFRCSTPLIWLIFVLMVVLLGYPARWRADTCVDRWQVVRACISTEMVHTLTLYHSTWYSFSPASLEIIQIGGPSSPNIIQISLKSANFTQNGSNLARNPQISLSMLHVSTFQGQHVQVNDLPECCAVAACALDLGVRHAS